MVFANLCVSFLRLFNIKITIQMNIITQKHGKNNPQLFVHHTDYNSFSMSFQNKILKYYPQKYGGYLISPTGNPKHV